MTESNVLISSMLLCPRDYSHKEGQKNKLTTSITQGEQMERRVLVFAPVLIFVADISMFAQGGQRGQRGRPPARPAPRTADGRMSLGPIPGELGVWLPGA